jgi:ribosomal protein L7/L12
MLFRLLSLFLWVAAGYTFLTQGFVLTALLYALGAMFAGSLARGAQQRQDTPTLNEAQLQEIRKHLAEDNRLLAVQRVREFTGMSLQEAVHFVDTLVPSGARAARYSLPLPDDLEDAIRVIAQADHFEAIKNVRELTGASLEEAKAYVDALLARR